MRIRRVDSDAPVQTIGRKYSCPSGQTLDECADIAHSSTSSDRLIVGDAKRRVVGRSVERGAMEEKRRTFTWSSPDERILAASAEDEDAKRFASPDFGWYSLDIRLSTSRRSLSAYYEARQVDRGRKAGKRCLLRGENAREGLTSLRRVLLPALVRPRRGFRAVLGRRLLFFPLAATVRLGSGASSRIRFDVRSRAC
jgi:hypothetical protein